MTLKIGLQMYSVRDELSADPLDTLRNIAAMGYRYLEFANVTAQDPGVGFRADPVRLKKVLAGLGCAAIGTHVVSIDEDSLDDIIAFHRALGTRFVISKMISNDHEDLERQARAANSAAVKLRDAGIDHAIHTGLIRSDGDRTDLDFLLDKLDRELTSLELDVYWVHRSGLDPIDLIKRHGSHIRLIHLKDIPRDIEQPVDIVAAHPPGEPIGLEFYRDPRYCAPDNFIELGAGTLPVQRLLDAARDYSAAEFAIVEQDFSNLSEMESARMNFDYLNRRNGVTPS